MSIEVNWYMRSKELVVIEEECPEDGYSKVVVTKDNLLEALALFEAQDIDQQVIA